MLTADQRKELEAIATEMNNESHIGTWGRLMLSRWADRIAAVLANVEEK